MARVLKFRKATTDTDLLSGDFRFKGWASELGNDKVIETIELLLIGDNADIIAGGVSIDDLTDDAQQWFDDILRGDEIWIHAYADGESAKRALVEDIKVQHVNQPIFNSLLGREGIAIDMAVTRWPWENTTQEVVNTVSGISAWGGMIDLSGQAAGNLPGRPHKTSVKGRSGGGGPMTKFWVGSRPLYEGLLNFDPIMECENGTPGTDAAVAADAGASGGSKVRVTFSTTTLAKRLNLSVYDAFGAAYASYVGAYVLLLRCKVSSGSTIGVQTRTGLTGSNVFAPNAELYDVTNTGWLLRPAGTFSIPVFGYRSLTQDPSAHTDVRNNEVEVWAEVITSNGSTDWIDLDAIGLLPSKHMVYGAGGLIQYTSTPDNVKVFKFANEQSQALSYVSNQPISGVEVRQTNWMVPTDPGVLVFFAERESSHVLTDAVDIELLHYPRWRSFRGS